MTFAIYVNSSAGGTNSINTLFAARTGLNLVNVLTSDSLTSDIITCPHWVVLILINGSAILINFCTITDNLIISIMLISCAPVTNSVHVHCFDPWLANTGLTVSVCLTVRHWVVLTQINFSAITGNYGAPIGTIARDRIGRSTVTQIMFSAITINCFAGLPKLRLYLSTYNATLTRSVLLCHGAGMLASFRFYLDIIHINI